MKALSRRGLFGAAAGAAVAGPAAIKSVLETPGVEPSYLGGPTVGLNSVSAYADVGWMKNEIAESLKHKEKLSAMKPIARSIRHEHFRIDGLRSVSPQQRARMMSEATVKFEHANQISYIDERIAEMKERLGILGHLL